MPIYEYECENCRNIIEKWQSITEKPLTTCPDCQGSLRKVISKSSFHLKGGGWFADGYSNGKSAPEKASDKKDNGQATGKDTKKTEKKTKDTGTAKKETGTGANA